MPLTRNQQQIVNRLPQNQRRSRINQFLQQNRNTPTRVNTTQRITAQPARIVNPTNVRVSRPVTNLGQTFSGTTVLVAYTTPDQVGFHADEISLSPANIPALAPISAVFEQWKYLRLAIYYTPSVSNTVAGHVLYAITPKSHPKPTNETAFFAIQNQRTTSVHTTAPQISASATHANTWFYTNKDTGLDTPLKVIVGSHAAPKGTALGIYLISYNIQFRGQS